MKIATYNVNGVNGRLDLLLRWLKEAQPDIVCLQELKSEDHRFPEKEITRAQIPKYRLPDEFNTYFLGRWLGTGKFASGKGIAADLSFKMALGNNWIIYEHTDQHPNRFKSLSIWGIDPKTGQFLAYSFDNFSGHKVFHRDGWKNGNLVLTTNWQGQL